MGKVQYNLSEFANKRKLFIPFTSISALRWPLFADLVRATSTFSYRGLTIANVREVLAPRKCNGSRISAAASVWTATNTRNRIRVTLGSVFRVGKVPSLGRLLNGRLAQVLKAS